MFSFISRKRCRVIRIWIQAHLKRALNEKNMPPGSFSAIKVLKSPLIKKCETFINWKSKKYYKQINFLWYQEHFEVIVEITDIKCELVSKHLPQKAQQHGNWTKPVVTLYLYKKECLLVVTWNKKHLSKQVLSIIYTL